MPLSHAEAIKNRPASMIRRETLCRRCATLQCIYVQLTLFQPSLNHHEQAGIVASGRMLVMVSCISGIV